MTMKEIISQALDSFDQKELRDLQKAMNNIMTDELIETMTKIEKKQSKEKSSVSKDSSVD